MELIKEVLAQLQLGELINYGVWDYFINVVIFGAIAIPLFTLFWVLRDSRLQARKIQPTPVKSFSGVRREIKNSIVSLLIFTGIDSLIYLAQLKGYTRIYTDVHQYGWWYLGFSVVVIILFHDAYVYAIHRFMHLPWVYDRIHKVHHQSTDPSPFAAFSFHPAEAVLEASVYVCLAFLLPVHLVALWTWQIIQITLSVIAHLGYEIYPKGFNTHWLFKYKTPSTHHNMHHAKFNGNYGLYFTWWDKFFGTEFKDYHQTYQAIHERVAEAKHREFNWADYGGE